MSEEKKNAKLNEEELEKVSGGGKEWGGYERHDGSTTSGSGSETTSCSYFVNGVCIYPGGSSECPNALQGLNMPCEGVDGNLLRSR